MATKDPEENKDDLRIGISCRDRDSGDIITFCASDGETLDELGSNNSIGILGDKENFPSFLQKNITVSENGEEMKAGEQTTENKENKGEGNRGADDIASCVYKYIENKINNSNQNVDVVFYSDSCCGQNKNQFVIALYIFAVLKFARLKSITHKYLIPGHTQNENDNAHSVIEKEIKRNLKSGPIYTPLQYAQIIKTAKKQGKPYKLNELSHQDLMSMKKLQADLKFSMKGLKISEVKIIKYSKESPEVLLYKKSYAETEFSEAKIWRRMPNTLPELKPAYPNGVELGTKKG